MKIEILNKFVEQFEGKFDINQRFDMLLEFEKMESGIENGK